jgi:hypothetical protein
MIEQNVSTSARTPQEPFDISKAIEFHIPLARKIASIANRRYGCHYELDDLEGYANLGLVRAARKYSGLQDDLRQAIDFTAFCEKRIWRAIELGRDTMSTIHRAGYRMIRKGKMVRPTFLHDSDAYSLADSILSGGGNPADIAASKDVDDRVAWLRKSHPLRAQIVDLHTRGISLPEIGRRLGRTSAAVARQYRAGIAILRWKYAGTVHSFH